VYDTEQLWLFLPLGYLMTVAIEGPVLFFGLSARHSIGDRLKAGLWLTAVTYPIVIVVLPLTIPEPRWLYLLIAETFAPGAECLLFWAAFVRRHPPDRRATLRDMAAVTLANLASFGFGELLWWLRGAI